MNWAELLDYLLYGAFILVMLYFISLFFGSSANTTYITISNPEEEPISEEEKTLLTEWDGSSGCKPGFTRQKDLCIKQCYEHPSLADLYKRPESRPNNVIAKFGVDDRWENISSAKDYCYMCPPGYSLGSYDEFNKKMSCVKDCPENMAENNLAETCYRGYLPCSPSDSLEQCALIQCSAGYVRKTNAMGQVVCVDPNMGCPVGMKNNPDYLGCWKDKTDALVSTVEDMYLLKDLSGNIT